MSAERRCSSCGGLAAADAEWCGQCFAPLRARAPEEAPLPPAPPGTRAEAAPVTVSTPGGGGVEVAGGRATWDCPVCGERNPIDANVCATCQTPFARLFQEPAAGPALEPRTAALWSLVFAGLGHWKAGLRVDGFGRMVVFAWTLGTVIVVLASRPASGGFGSSFTLFALYAASAAAVYVLSAVDAYRVVAGDEPLVPSRTLLWASAGLVLVSVALATLVTLPAARG